MRDGRYAEATFDDMDMWQADRDFLTSHGYIQRSMDIHFNIVIAFYIVNNWQLIRYALLRLISMHTMCIYKRA